jgi:micrococcal nuclease
MNWHIFLIAILAAGCTALEPSFNISNESRIYQVVDGDTFILSTGEYVRLIGIDAPEKGAEKYHDATDFLRTYEGKQVTLEQEGENRDRYGRLLRHAYVNNTNLALLLLTSGNAEIYAAYNGTQRTKFEQALNQSGS